MFAALLDTSVLWPSLQRDFLLSLAAEGMYRPIWSQAILDELVYAEAAKRIQRGAAPEQAQRAAEHLATQMNWAFDDSSVTGWEPLVGSYGLPDPNDEHLVAAAVVGGAGVIVSDNVRDLPDERLPVGISVSSAAKFAVDTVSLDPLTALQAIRRISGRYTTPRRSEVYLLSVLDERYGMGEAVALMRTARDAIGQPS